MFHIGQRIVCIHDVSSPSANEFQNVPLKGSIYTVRGFVSPDIGYERTPEMLLEEIMNPRDVTPQRYAVRHRHNT